MEYREFYDKYYKRMAVEAVIKAVVCGLIVGFAVNAVVALATWFTDFNGLWVSLAALVAVTGAAIPAFYYLLFRPSEERVARRLDRMGLDERVITMHEYRYDSSFMAQRQRVDAVASVDKLEKRANDDGESLIQFNVATPVIVAASVVGAFAIAMSIVTGLSGFGIIRNGRAFIGDIFPASVPTYSINYAVDGEAELTLGKTAYDVKSGESTDEILYTAARYYYFTQWADNYGTVYTDGPSRHESNVLYSKDMTAYFALFEAPEEDDNLYRKIVFDDDSEEGNNPGNGHGGGGDPVEQFDNIIDGNTPYGEHYSEYYEKAMDYLANHPDLSEAERVMIESYFEFLK